MSPSPIKAARIFSSRADLLSHNGFQHLGTDSSGNPLVWENHYDSGDAQWSDEWSCQCDDECPVTGRSCSPVESVWIGPSEQSAIDLWESLPDA